jgi:CHAD domain-containing protein
MQEGGQMATDRKIEVEAKYRVARPGAADRYLVAPDLGPFGAQGAVRSIRIEDRYVDSPDWALTRAGFAARLRKSARGVEIGLKSRNVATGGVHRREEIEGPADSGLAPSAWPQSSARDVVLEYCGDQDLVEIVTLRQLRRVRLMQAAESTAELSVDEVEVIGRGGLLDKFEELEVELKSGDETALSAVVAILDGDPALQKQSRSKLDRAIKAVRSSMPSMTEEERRRWQEAPEEVTGRRQKSARSTGDVDAESSAANGGAGAAADPAAKESRKARRAREAKTETEGQATAESPSPDAEKALQDVETDVPPAPGNAAAEPTRVKPDSRNIGIQAADSMPEAARKVLSFHFRKLKNREAGTRSGKDVEELHDMRVAARRMRAAWRVFDGSFKPGKTRKLRRRLGVLADRLGTVRDLDVLLQNLEVYRSGVDEGQRSGLEPLASLWRKERGQARAQLIGELDSGGYATFLDDMGEFLDSGVNAAATVAAPTSPHRVRDCAPSTIWSSYEAVRVYELVLPWADVETLHELRISTKWLRYSLEFFGELLGPDADLLTSRVAALQDHLGCLHDADVAAKLTRDVLVSRSGELSRTETVAIGAYLQAQEREVARRRRALGPVWRAVNGAPFRRALGRATASL